MAIGGVGITGLACNAVCHFRAAATNTFGTTLGTDTAFTTPPCTPSAFKGFVYALDDRASPFSNLIYAFGVTTAGALTQIPGFPVESGGGWGPSSSGGPPFSSQKIAYDAVNARLYATSVGAGTLSAFAVNRATGALASLPYSPIALGSGFWNTVEVHPSGSPVVVGDDRIGLGAVASFVVTPTTATAAAGSPFATGLAVPFWAVFQLRWKLLLHGG